MFWKIQEIFYSMGTEFFLFGLKEAGINGFKDGWGQNKMSGPREPFKCG